MTPAGAPATLPALRALLWLAWRRRVNRLAVPLARRMRKRRKASAAPVGRSPTGRKRGPLGIFMGVVGLVLLYQVGFMSWCFLRKVVATEETRPRLAVATLKQLANIQVAAPHDRNRFESDASYQVWRQEWLRRALARDGGIASLPAADRPPQIARLLEVYAREGAAGFTPDRGLFSPVVMPREPAARARVQQRAAALLLLLLAWIALLALGLQNQDLGQVEWNWLWLTTLPITARTLFWGKLAEYTLLSASLWMMCPVFLILFGVIAGRSLGGACALGVALSLALAVLLAAFRLWVETWARMRLRFQARKNVQAVASVLGIALIIAAYSTIFPMDSLALPRWFLALAGNLPQAGLLTGWIMAIVDPVTAVAWQGLAILLGTVVIARAAVWGCTRLVRGGFDTGLGTPPRRSERAGHGTVWSGFDAAGRDLRALLRDRALFVQTLIAPLAVIGFQFVVYRKLLVDLAIWSQSRFLAALAFGLGAYSLAVTATSVLAAEHKALWLLWTSPLPIVRVLARKTVIWALLALGCPVIVLTAGAFGCGFDHGLAPGHALLAVAMIGVFAFIAAGVGAAHTDPFAELPQQRVKQGAVLTYLLLFSMGSAAIAQPSAHVKIAFFLLSLLLAWALWQRLRRRLPWLLDPVAGPPPELDLVTAAGAALGFLALQSVIAAILVAAELPVGKAVILSYGASGLVVAGITLAILLSGKVPHVWRTVGLRLPVVAGRSRGVTVRSGLTLGAGSGLLAGLAACGYLAILRQIPWIRELLAAQEQAAMPALWSGVLLVVLAPLCEEFLFRGLLLSGLRASLRPGVAMLASAAIFAVLHPTAGLPAVFALGLVTGWLFLRTGWLGPSVVAHALYNATVFAWG